MEFPQWQWSRRLLDQLMHQIDARGLPTNSGVSSVRTSSTEQCNSGVFDCCVSGSTVLVCCVHENGKHFE